MPLLAIVGAGISGLGAATAAEREAARLGLGLEVVVLEREAAIGGKVQSVRDGSWLVEAGPIGYLDTEPAVDELIEAAGLGAEQLAASAASRRRFLVRAGQLQELERHPVRFARSGILSARGLARAATEPFRRRRHAGEGDESVWGFAARRLGREVADELIHPLVIGVFAGDARRLSLAAAFPRMAELEQEHGSLIKAAIALKWARRRGLPRRSRELTSFRSGLQALPHQLVERGRFSLRRGAAVERLEPRPGGGYALATASGGEPFTADAVVLAGEAWAMAPLVAPLAPRLAAELASIAYPPVAVVALGYGREARARIPAGFGVLISRRERFRTLGVTWDSALFPGRAAEDHVLVRALLGGTWDPAIADLELGELTTLASAELAELFGLREPPVFSHATLWPRAIPQYELGHGARVTRIEAELAELPGLYLAGNALKGSSFAAAAARGVACGRQAAAELAASARR